MIVTSNKTLDAINDMLATIGEAPVNTLDNSENVDVALALRVLDKVNKQVQSQGWSFNTNTSATLSPDVKTNKIKWQDDILYIVGTDGTKYVQKGDYVYDFDNQTATFDNPIDVELIRLVDFDYMPVPARDYIVAKASRIFNSQTLNDPDIAENVSIMEREAWAAFQEYEMELNDFTMYDIQNVQQLKMR